MARIFITGSADGLGLLAAQQLVARGHDVTLHARSAARAEQAQAAEPGASAVLVGDLASLQETRALAEQANAGGPFDGVIHNAGVGHREPRRVATPDGLPTVFQINVLAPYVLTALMERPGRLVYLSSGLHRSGDPDLSDLTWSERPWDGLQAYSDSKLLDAVLAAAVARHWPKAYANAVEPGWVATKMGGAGAPDDLQQGAETQAWLVAGTDPAADVSGGYFYHREPAQTHPAVNDRGVQQGLLRACERLSGARLPAA